MWSRCLIVIGCVLSVSLGFAALAEASYPYVVTDLGSLGGPSSALGINNAGQVVGYSYATTDTTTGDYRAFVYSNGTMTDIFGAPSSSIAYSINNSGKVAGSVFYLPTGATTPIQAGFVYDQPTNAITSVVDAGGKACEALSINDSGHYVGYVYIGTDTTTQYFMIYDGTNINAFSFGGATPTGTVASANSVNNSDFFVGGYNTTAGATVRGYVSDLAGNAYDLGTLGGNYCVGNAINAVNTTTGNFQIAGISSLAGDAAAHGFVLDWNSGTMSDVGTLGGTNSTALGLNTAGKAVGAANITGDTAQHAFLYTGGTLQDLNSDIDPAAGWTLYQASGINDSDWICGYGTNAAGETHAFLLKPNTTTYMDGDANKDGMVDIQDLNIVITNYNKTGMVWTQGDFTADGSVDLADLNKVLTNYNKTAALQGVPEPSAVVLLLTLAAGVIGLAISRRR